MASHACSGAEAMMREEICVLVGHQRGHLWYGRLRERRVGTPGGVDVDWSWVLEREERRGDVIGFYHTHPPGFASPSGRDVRTMRAWVSCFGKPLLCVIESGGVLRGFRFENDEACGEALNETQRFPQSVIVGVESDLGVEELPESISRAVGRPEEA